MSSPVYEFAGLRFDPADGRLARIDGAAATQLRPQVARLLAAFLNQPETVIDREQLYRTVWDEGTVIDFESGLAAVLRELRAELKRLEAPADLVETVPRRGYRLNSPVQHQAADRAPHEAISPAGRKRLIGLGLAMLLLLVAGLFSLRPTPEPLPSDPADRALAVLPFSQFGVAAQDPRQLDLLLADRVLVQLWERQLEGVMLIGRASIAPYEGRDDLAAAVAADLGIDLLIEGSVVFDGDQVSVSARLLDMPPGRILWSHQVEHGQDEMPPVAELARVLVDSLVEAWE